MDAFTERLQVILVRGDEICGKNTEKQLHNLLNTLCPVLRTALQAESSVDIPPDEKLPGVLLLLVHPDVAIRAWALE